SDCPQKEWQDLNIARLSWQNRALVMRNGPRYWMIDGVQSGVQAPRPTKVFGGLTMRFGATISGLNPLTIGPLRVQRVARNAVMTFNAGSTVYELTAPDGRTFVMQSYSQQVDRTLTEASLGSLAERLRLPAGWRYGKRTLSAPLVVDTTNTPASVLQDRFQNTYSLHTAT
ncbi:MAG: hypothetical protein JHD16_17850, partial [Solirubrobacteraceae bacterium]|nr:hypothetical protein [Solirubrobacteraceae bacterium]